MKKISAIVTGLAIAGILTVSLNTFTQQAMNRGDGGAPARPDYVNIGDGGGSPSNAHGNGGGIVAKEI
ncbi:Phr family secreted Rap phosphatase inhibitor [Bacillus pseudomycoides]|uniref:Phr family secreted Rap phosphatase inhibitor n=1 Tax=Bacillus pseudomycoides TaxID=64104 RepID=UPI000BECA870|nr:Phr family secreted Rap phosphatase inhibitor [Bacillus pseudomycoides]PDZ12082.1 Phr family secreted Rap phosphatase inhibitor [Bacillus pseudomycoides]